MAEASSKTPVKVDNSKNESTSAKKDDSRQEAGRSVDRNGNPIVSFAELDEFHEQIPGIAAPEAKK